MHISPVKARVLIGTIAAAVASAGLAVDVIPMSAAATPTPFALDQGPGPDSMPTQSIAVMAAAQQGGERVEDVSQRTETTQVYANPDGTWSSESSSEPVRVQAEDGAWHDIDTTLVERDGALVPRYAAAEVEFSTGGDRTFASVTEGGSDLDWRWPAVLPAPVVDGNKATYVGVAADGKGDLVVEAHGTGFQHFIVLNEQPESPIEFTIPVAAQGAELSETRQGGLEIETASGETLVSAPRPLMWDADVDGSEAPVEAVPVDTAVGETPGGAQTLTLSPDQDFLDNPDTTYPVTIDPAFSTYVSGDSWVSNDINYSSSQTSSPELRVGTRNGGTTKARAFINFDRADANAVWKGKNILGAYMVLRNFDSSSCAGAPIRATRITGSWGGNTLAWGQQPSVTTDGYDDYGPAYGADGCAAGDAKWWVKAIVQYWADHPGSNEGIRLAAYNETNSNSYRRYRSANVVETGLHLRPRIDVTYNSHPNTASAPVVSPSSYGYATSLTPTVSTRVVDPDGSTVSVRFEIIDSAGAVVWSGTSAAVASGAEAVVAVPAGKLALGATYAVRAKGVDLYNESRSWSDVTPFTIDPAGGTPMDPVVQQILDLTPGATKEEVMAGIDALVVASQADPDMAVPLTFDQAKQATLDSLTEVVAEVEEEQAHAEAELASPDPGAGDLVEADPGEDTVVEEAPAETEPIQDIQFAAASSPTGGQRIRLPAAKRYGDIVVAPNKTKFIPHGHAAIFTTYNTFAHAPGPGYKVQVVYRTSRQGAVFAPGAKMMSVYTDEGNGPLLSYEKRAKAVSWAQSRSGDHYRPWSEPNAFRVTGSVGSRQARQNCSQLIWGAYNYANGYNFNPVPAWMAIVNPSGHFTDKSYVHPYELTDAPQTKVYRTVYKDVDK